MDALNTLALIDHLQERLRDQRAQLDALRGLPLETLTRRPAPKRWSALEVVEHMNLSSGVYHRRLDACYARAHNRLRFAPTFTPGRWGQLATRAMQPGADGRIGWRMRTLFLFEPRTAHTQGLAAIDRCAAMLHGLHGLLERARTRGLDGERITSTLGPVLRFKVGDAFRFPIAHQDRHFLQIRNTLKELS